jgi:hypothetical protein
MSEEEQIYNVEKILAKKYKPELMYLIKWEGWDSNNATWEPLSNLINVMDMVEEFEEQEARLKKNNSFLRKKRSPSPYYSESSESYSSPKNDYRHKKFRQIRDEIKERAEKCRILKSLDEDEVPETILSAKLFDNKIAVMVEFKGKKSRAWVYTNVLADLYPKILVKYYENNLKFKK